MSLVLVGAAVLLVGAGVAVSWSDNRRRVAAALTSQLVATLLVLWTVVPVLFGRGELRTVLSWSFPIGDISLHVDALSAFFLAFSLPLTLIGSLYATGYMRQYLRPDPRLLPRAVPHASSEASASSISTAHARAPREPPAARHLGVHFSLISATMLSFIMIYSIENIMAFYIAWEIAALAAWMLVIWDYKNQKIRFAGFNYLVSTHLSFLFLVAATMIMVSKTGSADFAAFERFLRSGDPLRDVVWLLLVVAFALKSAFFPFHTWLPRAHAAAPAHVSALMSGVIHKAGLYGLLRVTLLLGEPDAWMGYFLLAFSLLSALVGVIYTATQRDLKRVLGYSSTENVGIVGVGIAIAYLGADWREPTLVCIGISAAILHILNHALFKCLLFYGAGAIYRATHTVDMERLGGAWRAMPWTALFFFVGAAAIAGLPPLNGFTSEALVYVGLLAPQIPAGIPRGVLAMSAALLALTGGVSLLAMARAFAIPFLGVPREPAIAPKREAAAPMLLAMGFHAGLVVVLGVLPALGLAIVREPTRPFLALLGPSGRAFDAALPAAITAPFAALAAGLLVVTGLLLLARRALRAPRALPHVTWGCGYTKPMPRMQYTGGSFSQALTALILPALVYLRRERLPGRALFPHDGHLHTSCVDSVERRMFEVLGAGDDLVKDMATNVPETPRLSFALGLGTVVVLVGLLLLARSGSP